MGPSLTGASGELADSLDHFGAGLDGGVALRWPRSEASWGVQAELLLAIRSRFFDDIIGFRRSLRVAYVQVPVLARTSLRRSGTFRPYALAGPYFASRLSSGIQPGGYAGDEPADPNDVRAYDAGVMIGIGSDLVTSQGRATFELRVGLGLVDVLEDRARLGGTYRVLTLMLAFNPGERSD
jgi:hypothetical protein